MKKRAVGNGLGNQASRVVMDRLTNNLQHLKAPGPIRERNSNKARALAQLSTASKYGASISANLLAQHAQKEAAWKARDTAVSKIAQQFVAFAGTASLATIVVVMVRLLQAYSASSSASHIRNARVAMRTITDVVLGVLARHQVRQGEPLSVLSPLRDSLQQWPLPLDTEDLITFCIGGLSVSNDTAQQQKADATQMGAAFGVFVRSLSMDEAQGFLALNSTWPSNKFAFALLMDWKRPYPPITPKSRIKAWAWVAPPVLGPPLQARDAFIKAFDEAVRYM